MRSIRWRPGREIPGVTLPQGGEAKPDEAEASAGPIDAYAAASFIVILGTGEHLESQRRNLEFAQWFMRRWVDHSQGAPKLIRDVDFVPEQHAESNWVLIGGPRSNSVSALIRGGAAWPVQGDSRTCVLPVSVTSEPPVWCGLQGKLAPGGDGGV